jgi:DNA repair exonuclease SbcCD ATPase subunit
LQAFQDAQFSQARKLYEAVLDSAADPLVLRKARYGAACSALAGASDEAELKEAQQLFERWALEAPGHLQSEDPRLLYPVLKDYYLQSTNTVLELKKDCRRLEGRSSALLKEKEELQAEKTRLQEEKASLEEEKSRLEEEVAMLQKKLDALEELQNELRKMRQDTEK